VTLTLNNLNYNKLHGWAIEKELVELINSKLPEGKVILEFGSGAGTDVLLERYHVISVEHDINFVCRRSDSHLCFFAPLENNWYPRNVICEILKMKYDLILIDGPPRELRRGILQNLDLFEGNGHPIVIFDDINRDLDHDIMILFCKRLNYSYRIVKGSKKMFALCEKRMTEYDRSNHINLKEKRAINSFLSQTVFRELYNKCSRRDYIYNFSIFFYLGILKSYSPNSDHLERNINTLLDMIVPNTFLSDQSQQGTLTIRNKFQIIVTYNIVFKQINEISS
jgi:hypothetical protein